MLRRSIALLILFGTFGSNAESVVGVLRDGEVHHESPVAAAQHAANGVGEHGHEDAAPSGSHQHGKEHEHGTSGDHCTHTHSVPLLLVFTRAFPVKESAVGYVEPPALHLGRISHPLFHPPKA